MAALTGRVLICRRCSEPVRVYELPGEFLDPDRFCCGNCLTETPEDPPQP